MKKCFNILFAMIIASPLMAQVRQERDFERSFSVPENAKVEVVSKYGEVIVRTWELDSIRFEVVVRAEGKNTSAVNKSMSRVNVKFRKIGSVISAVTEIGSSGGIFGNVISEVGGALGNNKLKVDYQVWMPKGVMLSVENKYGDLYMADVGGRVDLDISHGDIKANNIEASLNLKHSFGKASFGKLNDGIFTLRGSDIAIDEAKDLNIESGSSEIRVDRIDRIQLNSRNDKIQINLMHTI